MICRRTSKAGTREKKRTKVGVRKQSVRAGSHFCSPQTLRTIEHLLPIFLHLLKDEVSNSNQLTPWAVRFDS